MESHCECDEVGKEERFWRACLSEHFLRDLESDYVTTNVLAQHLNVPGRKLQVKNLVQHRFSRMLSAVFIDLQAKLKIDPRKLRVPRN